MLLAFTAASSRVAAVQLVREPHSHSHRAAAQAGSAYRGLFLTTPRYHHINPCLLKGKNKQLREKFKCTLQCIKTLVNRGAPHFKINRFSSWKIRTVSTLAILEVKPQLINRPNWKGRYFWRELAQRSINVESKCLLLWANEASSKSKTEQTFVLN